MERSVREGRQNRSRSRLQEEGEEGYTGSYRKDDKKKKYTNSRPKVVSGSQAGDGVGQSSSGFHRQRDVPPRFQTYSKPTKQHKYSTTRINATGGKKQTKDPNRWHQNPPSSSMHPLHHPTQTTTSHHHTSQLHNSSRHRRMDDDGGWSRGCPAKGSGWSSKSKNHNLLARDMTKTGNQAGNHVILDRDWGGSPEVDSAAAVWPISEHKHQGSGGSGEGEVWNTFSPGQSNSSRQHSQSENWMSDEGSPCVGDNVCSPQSNSSPSPSNVVWNIVPDVPNLQHELEPIEDDELDAEIPSIEGDRAHLGGLQQCETSSHTGKSGEEDARRQSSSWDELESIHLSSSERDTLAHTEHAISSSSSSCSENLQHRCSPSSKNTSCSPSADLDKVVEVADNAESGDTTSADRETPKRHEETAATSVPNSRESTLGGTPDGGLGMSVWKSHANVGGSTSSINSVGSNSSWKSEGKNGFHTKAPNFSPRKTTRYDSQSSSVSSGSGVKIRKIKKPSSGLDDALESLHSEPSGWGELPSPKPTDVDNGTEIWGVPDDMHRKAKSSNGWGDGVVGKMGGGMVGGGGGDWGEETAGTMSAGWPGVGDSRSRAVGRVGTPGTPGSQWIPQKQDGWGKKSKQHNFPDNVSKLMDMGFSHQRAEKYLKANGNDLNATISDLLALEACNDGSLERVMSSSTGGRTNKKEPGNTLFGGSSNSFSGMTTPPSGGPPGTPGVNPHKDLYRQSFGPNPFSPLSQTHPPLPSGGSQAQQMQLLQMKQQYTQMPSATVLGYQQMLGQQLSQLKTAKQQVMQQLKQVSTVSVPGSGSSGQQQQQQQLQAKLNLINQFISHINQQLMLQKYPPQQTKDKTGMVDGMKSIIPGAVGSQPIGRNSLPSRNKDMKVPSRSLSLPGGAHEHNLALSMQGLSMNGHVTPSSISQSSARSISRLQQIISGSSADNPHPTEDKTKFWFPPVPQSAATPAEMSSFTSSPLASSGSSTTTTTPASTPFSPARSFTDIQEFRPGVPWQPRALPTEPAQLYAKPVPLQHPELRTAQSEPSFSQHDFPQGLGMRQQKRPPSLGYNMPGGNMAPGGFRGRGTPSDQQQQGWPSSNMTRGSTSSPMMNSPFSVAGTPDSALPPNTFSGRRRYPNQMPLPRSASNLAFNGSVEVGPPFTRPNALFPNSHTLSQAPACPTTSSSSSTGSDTGGRWGSSSRSTFPNSSGSSSSSHPPSSLSSSVWDSSAAGSNQSSWSSLGMDVHSDRHNTAPTSAPEPAGFNSPPNTSDVVTPGLGGAWDKGGLQSPSHKKTVLSPEPTFAEWQAGKKAHLSVFKLPSNPPTPWLCIQNVNSQVDEASLRDVCSEFGMLESVVFSRETETAVVQYTSKEQAMQAKSGLDKSPVICGVTVVVDFVSEEKVASLFIHQQQHSHQKMSGSRSSAAHDKWLAQSSANPPPAGNSGLVNGSHWDSRNLGHSAQTQTSTGSNNDGDSDKSNAAAATLWSGNTFLPGLSSPWSSQPQPESALFPSGTRAGKQEPANMSNSPSLNTYLPNGLF